MDHVHRDPDTHHPPPTSMAMRERARDSARASLLPKPRPPPRSALKKPAAAAPRAPQIAAPASTLSKPALRSRLPHPTANRRVPPPTLSASASRQVVVTHTRAGSGGHSRTLLSPQTLNAPQSLQYTPAPARPDTKPPSASPPRLSAPHPARAFESTLRVVTKRPIERTVATPARAAAAYPTPPASIDARAQGDARVEKKNANTGRIGGLLDAEHAHQTSTLKPVLASHNHAPLGPSASVGIQRSKAIVTSSTSQKENLPPPALSVRSPGGLLARGLSKPVDEPQLRPPRPLLVRKPTNRIYAPTSGAVAFSHGVKSLLDEVDKFAVEWEAMFDDLLNVSHNDHGNDMASLELTRELSDHGDTRQASEFVQLRGKHVAGDPSPGMATPTSSESKSTGDLDDLESDRTVYAPSSQRSTQRDILVFKDAPFKSSNSASSFSKDETAESDDQDVDSKTPELLVFAGRHAHRDIAVVRDAPALGQTPHVVSHFAGAVEQTVHVHNKGESLGAPPLEPLPQVPSSTMYVSMLPEINMSPIIPESPQDMTAIISALSLESKITSSLASDPFGTPVSIKTLSPKSTIALDTSPYASSPLSHPTLRNATSPPSTSPLRGARAVPLVSSPLAHKSYTAKASPPPPTLVSLQFGAQHPQPLPPSTNPNPRPRPTQTLSPRPVSDSSLLGSPRQPPSAFPISTTPPARKTGQFLEAAPLRRSSSLRGGLGLKALFRRTDLFSNSPSTSSLLAPGGAEERARRRRAESLKGMISEPRVVSMGSLRGLGVSVGSASTSDLSFGRERTGGRGSLGLFGRSTEEAVEEYEMSSGAKVRRAGSVRNLLRKKTR